MPRRPAAASPIAGLDDVTEAVVILEERFSRLESQGPSNYARFFLGARDDFEDERTRLRRDAQGSVKAFLSRWRAIRQERI